MQKSTRTTQIIRWAARILSLGAWGLVLLFLLDGSTSNFTTITLQEWIGLIFFPFGVAVGLTLAWWRETPGAIVALGSLVVFYIVSLAMGEGLPGGPFFLLVTAPAFLFLLCAWMDRKTAETAPAG